MEINMSTIQSTFYGVTADSVGSLFSSTGSNSSGTSGTGTILSDYYSIKNGSYKKLLTAYYKKLDSSDKQSSATSNSTSSDTTKTLTAIKSSADSLYASADKLLEQGSSSVFAKKDGKYDMDAIYDSVKKFVDDYNSVIENGAKSNTTSVLRTVSNMVEDTKSNSKNLANLGITIGSDNKLQIGEALFKKSDASDVKSMFNGAGSYGYTVLAKASQLNYNVNTEANKSNTYGNAGKYNYNYSAGDIYDSLF